MYDVIVVEDKKITREGLMHLVDWGSIGGYAAASFAGANAAIAYIDHHHVDLIVTDIAMPDGSGLDLLQYVYEHRPDVKVIIISAYEKFSYAHQALAMGASAYLLKPVDSNELLQHAKRTFDEIEQRRRVKTQESFLRWSSVADEIARRLADGTPEQLAGLLQSMQESFVSAGASFLYFRAYGSQALSCARLRVIANETGQPIFLFQLGADLCGILSGALAPSPEVLQILLDQWALRPPYRMGISAPATDGLPGWYNAFVQARAAFCRGFWLNEAPGVRVFTPEDLPEGGQTPAHLDYAELKKDLWANTPEAALQHLQDMLEQAAAQNSALQPTINALESTLMRLYEAGGFMEEAPPQLHQSLAACTCRDELHRVAADALTRCFHLAAAHQDQTVRPIVKLALEYSIKHIDQAELNLKMVAQRIGVSYVYLSKAFKDDFGQGYSEYIARYRIELAKDYLLEPHAHVYEVCAKIGLEPKNFHGLFKKYTGMTPKTYQARNVHYED